MAAVRRRSSTLGLEKMDLSRASVRRKSSTLGLDKIDLVDFKSVGPVGIPSDVILLVKDLERRVRDCRFPGSLIPRVDSEFLLKFLRRKDYNISEALESLKIYYTCIYRNFDIIKGVSATDVTSAFNSKCLFVLKQSVERVRVAVFHVKYWKPKEVNLRNLQLASVFVIEQCLTQAQVQENGFSVIFDCEGLSLEHLRNFSVKELRRNIQVVLEGLPVRARSMHCLNPPRMFWPFYKIGMQFLKEKMRNRVHLHYDLKTLHEVFPKEILPQSLGGNLSYDEAVDTQIFKELIEKDPPYEEYWNGGIGKPNMERRFSRKRSFADVYTN